jgi:hypothetical protein
MEPDKRFANKPLEFWAYVRLVSERLGYYDHEGEENGEEEKAIAVVTEKKPEQQEMVFESEEAQYQEAVSIEDVVKSLTSVSVRLPVRFTAVGPEFSSLKYDAKTKTLSWSGSITDDQCAKLIGTDTRKGWINAISNLGRLSKVYPPVSPDDVYRDGKATELGQSVVDYLNYRLRALREIIRPKLMDRDEAQAIFAKLQKDYKPKCLLPMNKQKGEKRHHAYLTCILNMLTEKALGNVGFDDNPRGLITISRDGKPFRTFSRWMDGAYPHVNDPQAVWEVKEYYGTTSFGSRVADGVYESMLDGMEFAELRECGQHVLHYLIVDDRYTWWTMGKSYLCRLVDLLHMGLVDEVLFGREVLDRWPEIVQSWITKS